MSDEIIAQVLLVCFQIIKERPDYKDDVIGFAARLIQSRNNLYRNTGL